MTKKHLLFSLILTTLTSSTYGGNLKDYLEDFQAFKAKAAETATSEEDIIKALDGFKQKTSVRIFVAQRKFVNNSEGPYNNWQLNYKARLLDVQNGGDVDEASKEALLSTNVFLNEKLEDAHKKAKLFEGTVKYLTKNRPSTGVGGRELLPGLKTLLDASGLSPETRYTYDALTQEVGYSPDYMLENYRKYSQAYYTLPSQDKLKVFPSSVEEILTKYTFPFGEVLSYLQEDPNVSILAFVRSKKDQWHQRVEQNSTSIKPVFPYEVSRQPETVDVEVVTVDQAQPTSMLPILRPIDYNTGQPKQAPEATQM